MKIKISAVIVSERLREVDHFKVAQLAKSMLEVGLLNPVTVSGNNLVAGSHRLEAAKILGWETIQAINLAAGDDVDLLKIVEIDENLMRNELTTEERHRHRAERVRLTEKRNLPNALKRTALAKAASGSIGRKAAAQIIENTTLLSGDHTKVSRSEKKVIAGAKRAARAEAIQTAAEVEGISAATVRESLREHEAPKPAPKPKELPQLPAEMEGESAPWSLRIPAKVKSYLMSDNELKEQIAAKVRALINSEVAAHISNKDD